MDNLLHVWDTRKSRRAPTIILNSSTSATKIAWEKIAGDLLASTHENQLKVWDIRGRTDQPLSIYVNRETDLGAQCFGNLDFFNARSRRILSIDFSHNKRNVIVTGSADSVVRVLEINKASNTDAADVIFQVLLILYVKTFGKSLVKNNRFLPNPDIIFCIDLDASKALASCKRQANTIWGWISYFSLE